MALSYHIPDKLDKKQPYIWLASWFGCGFISPAPGTWGSLGGLLSGAVIYILAGFYVLCAAIIIVALIGLWSADKFDKAMDGHDSKMIVIDEVAGQWIAMLSVLGNPALMFISFIAFRFFDILKPWPVSFFDQEVKGAAGVMGDDIIAGFMVLICMMGLQFVF